MKTGTLIFVAALAVWAAVGVSAGRSVLQLGGLGDTVGGVTDTAGQAASGVTQGAGSTVSGVGDTASGAVSDVGGTVSDVGGSAGQTVSDAGQTVSDTTSGATGATGAATDGATGGNGGGGGGGVSTTPTIDGLGGIPESLAGPLESVLQNAPEQIREPLTNMVAAANQNAGNENLTDGLSQDIIDQVTGQVQDVQQQGLVDQLLDAVRNLLGGLSNREIPEEAEGCQILYLQLRGIVLQAIDLDVDNVCL